MERIFLQNLARLLTIILVSIMAAILVGCNGGIPPTSTEPPQKPPTPTSTLTPTMTPTDTPTPTPTSTPCLLPEIPILDPSDEVSIQPGAQLPIRAIATNAETFKWIFNGDGILSSEPTDVAIYTAPDKSGGLATVSVKASNVCGDSPSVSLIIHISNIIVSLDKIGVPEAWMTNGDKDPAEFISMQSVTDGCKTNKCYQFTYKPGNVWAGIMWWPEGCSWSEAKGGTCGIQIFDQKDLTSRKLTFWARGENGGETVQFKVGALDIIPSPPESTKPIPLSQAWEQYEILLSADMNLDDAIALFTWVAADLENKENIVFYLESIQFEGLK